MIEEVLPDIPRWLTSLAEWGACLVYVLHLRKRQPLRSFVLTLAVGLAAMSAVQELAGRLPLSLWLFGMLFAAATMFGFIYACADVRPRMAGYYAVRAFVLAELVASLFWQLKFFFDVTQPEAAPRLAGIAFVLVYGGGLVLVWVVERRQFPSDVTLDISTSTLSSATAIAAITFLISNLSFVDARTPFSGRAGPELFYIRTLVDLAGFVALYAQHSHRLELHRSHEAMAMNRLIQNQHEQYLASQRNIDVVNRHYHDLKHHLQALRAERHDGLRDEYIDRLENSLRGYESQIDTGNRVLDVLIASRLAECAESSIIMTCVADGSSLEFVNAIDLSVLIGNALDNAIEATREIHEVEHRLIRVAVYSRSGLVMIRVDNRISGINLDFHDGLPRTTKVDAFSHGYGLTTMRQVAERYGGSLTVQVENGWFTLRVLVPAPAGTR